jgi:hypothetical protein
MALPPEVPLMRFWPAAGESMARTSAALGVARMRVLKLLAVTGSTPVKAMALPPAAKLPEPLVVAG